MTPGLIQHHWRGESGEFYTADFAAPDRHWIGYSIDNPAREWQAYHSLEALKQAFN